MRYWVRIDVGKVFHWICVLDEEGEVVLSERVGASEEELDAVLSRIAELGGERVVAIDLLGGPATALEAALLGWGERVFYVPGRTVDRVRDAYRGEAKSDPRDAFVIADQLRPRYRSVQEVLPKSELLAELKVLVSHRRDLGYWTRPGA